MSAQKEIIIIGAGAAGLIAAKELSAQYKVTVLEARPEAGGRTTTQYPAPGVHIETGAEFIHGELPITLSLLKEAGIPYHPINGEMYLSENGELKQEEAWIEDWDQLLDHMSKAPETSTMLQLLDQYYPADQFAALRNHVQGYVQGYDLAPLDKVSVKYLYDEWTLEQGTNYRIENGYTSLINYLSKGINLITNQTVQSITWAKDQVTLTTQDRSYTANKVLITVPVNILQNESIQFSPSLPAYTAAARQIGWGTVIKFNLLFKQAFWKRDIGFVLSDETVPVWWTQSADSLILTGWLGGPDAEGLQKDLLEKALSSLANIFNIPNISDLLDQSFIHNWSTAQAIHGGYSYGMPFSEQAKAVLTTPVADTIYFAGEALYTGDSPGTVEAALHNGKEMARKIGAN
ncbi:flavin monoamine oxidase family protein [Chitinophaga sancti]|uniref:Tryptophan 2-monooxygenase n=1 Tax=Chitinophaga sancti TaxID=1004 RepID=A0A1K1R6G9_9BACT|nr:NAD(P)/FAD-dependent oxidoreductase [Chitinophaga sancti]WQD64180.1 NAD(P)/FAD-dependent oxidoreductase [Chitinophaga sancti]WQG90196.1 NAD(P)/FAD-dependent oxidoreductase [Chitinophaga sancti]SFW67696.1 monoamine oxidase [Chitinophaga sancti]